MARILKVKTFLDSKLLGSIIRINRLRQNMSQTSLVEGICVPSYLSRIENAEVIPSIDVVNDLFTALGLSYFDDPIFIEESKNLFNDYVHALFIGELGSALELYKSIMEDEDKYYSSPIIIDYLIVKFMRLTASVEREEITEVLRLLESVVSHMTSDQLHNFWLHKGMDLKTIARDFEESKKCYLESEKAGTSGKLFQQMAELYFAWGNMLKALECINHARRLYGEEANLMGLIATYEIKGQIFIYEGQYESGLEYLKQCLELLRRIDEPTYSSYIYNHMAWAYARLGNNDLAKLYLLKSSEESELLLQISNDLIECLVNGNEPSWYHDVEAIDEKLKDQFFTGKYHKLEEKFLEERRDQLYREQRRYKLIDDYRLKKLLD